MYITQSLCHADRYSEGVFSKRISEILDHMEICRQYRLFQYEILNRNANLKDIHILQSIDEINSAQIFCSNNFHN